MFLPELPETFEWIGESWGAALRCRPLADVAPHLFTTRQLRLSGDRDWKRLATAVGAQDVLRVTQVHGRSVLIAGPVGTPADPSHADVLLSGESGMAVAVRAADCVPLLIADARSGAVAAVHAGWRGTAAGAATAAVEALQQHFGGRAADFVAAIGPCIGACCYEVGADVVDAFAAAGHPRRMVDRWFRLSSSGTPARPSLRLDVAAANRDQLVLAGVPETQVHVSGLCTAMHLELFASFRAEGNAAGRIAGVVSPREAAARP